MLLAFPKLGSNLETLLGMCKMTLIAPQSNVDWTLSSGEELTGNQCYEVSLVRTS